MATTTQIFHSLETDTLKVLAEKNRVHIEKDAEEELTHEDLIEALAGTVEDKGIRELTKMMKRTQLEEVCEMAEIEIDPKEVGNSATKAVLTKRVFEAMREEGLSNFVLECQDEELIRYLCGVVGIKTTGVKMGKMQSKLIKHIHEYGREVVFYALDLQTLQQIAADMKIKSRTRASRKQLLNAILYNTAIPAKKSVQKASVKVGKKKKIHLCTEYQQLFQHYLTSELVEFCRKKGMKTSGTKKELINRILAFNDGDKENVMSNTAKKGRPAGKKATLKVVEEELEDEESEDEAEEEEQVDEMEESEDEAEAEDDDREDLSGCVIAMTGTLSRKRNEIVDIIKANGGIYKSTVTKDCTHLVIADVNSTSAKANKARDMGIELVDEEFVTRFE